MKKLGLNYLFILYKKIKKAAKKYERHRHP